MRRWRLGAAGKGLALAICLGAAVPLQSSAPVGGEAGSASSGPPASARQPDGAEPATDTGDASRPIARWQLSHGRVRLGAELERDASEHGLSEELPDFFRRVDLGFDLLTGETGESPGLEESAHGLVEAFRFILSLARAQGGVGADRDRLLERLLERLEKVSSQESVSPEELDETLELAAQLDAPVFEVFVVLLFLCRTYEEEDTGLMTKLAAIFDQVARELDYPLFVALTQLIRVKVGMLEGDEEQVSEHLQRATDEVTAVQARNPLPFAVAESEANVAHDLAIVAIVKALADRDPQRAFELSLRHRRRSLLQLFGNPSTVAPGGDSPQWDLVAKRDAVAREIGELQAALSRFSTGMRLEERPERARLESQLIAKRDEYLELTDRLLLGSVDATSMAWIHEPSFAVIQAALPEGSALVEYLLLPHGVVAWVVDDRGMATVGLTIELTEVDAAMVLLRSPRSSFEERRAAARWLYRQLIEPLEQFLVGRSQLLIVPDGLLNQLPFAALRDVEGRSLVDRFSLATLPSSSLLPMLFGRRTDAWSGAARVLGHSAGGLLPGVLAEAERIAAILETEALVEESATEDAVRDSGGANVLHLAAHGSFDPLQPQFSALHLASEDRPQRRPGMHDGRLELHEIVGQLDLSGTKLVVLSACHSAQVGADGLSGFSVAFLQAGAPAVLAARWQVDDAAAVALMGSFYRRFLAGEEAAAALAGAQREIAGMPGWEAPYYWAGWVLVGDPAAGLGAAGLRAPATGTGTGGQRR